MAATELSFGHQQYWNERYQQASKTYDWLNHADVLDDDFHRALQTSAAASPQILHIGCGNSDLSFNLRMKVRDPQTIHNIDYSSVVIDWGASTEKTMFGSRGDDTDKDRAVMAMPMMRWNEVDLLSLQSIISCCTLGAYGIIIDKSTCDSLACTSTVNISFPYFLYTAHEDSDAFLDIQQSESSSANAVQLLAVHLALVALPKARWIAYSYSSTRFWFLEPQNHIAEADRNLPLHSGLPHPKGLWQMIEKRTMIKPYGASGTTAANEAGDTHFVFVMERTDLPLLVRTMDKSQA